MERKTEPPSCCMKNIMAMPRGTSARGRTFGAPGWRLEAAADSEAVDDLVANPVAATCAHCKGRKHAAADGAETRRKQHGGNVISDALGEYGAHDTHDDQGQNQRDGADSCFHGRLTLGRLEPNDWVLDDDHHSTGEEEHEKHTATDGTVKMTRVGAMAVSGVRTSTARKATSRTAKVTRRPMVRGVEQGKVGVETLDSFMTPTMASDPVATPPGTKLTLASDPVETAPGTKPTMTPDRFTTPSDRASFASLPREIRDKIYCLAVPHSCDFRLFFGRHRPPSRTYRILSPQVSTSMYVGRHRPPSRDYRILSPQASTCMYANEACAMFFKRNSFRVQIEHLQPLLDEDGISSVFHTVWNDVRVVPKGRFDVKTCLRDIVIDITMDQKMVELAGRIGLLLECLALRRVKVVLDGGRYELKYAITTIYGAFKALAEKLGRHLMFSLAVDMMYYYGQREDDERFIGDLEKLETVARDEDSDSEDDNSGK
ncbi:MAG: hypothetical protein ASARMPREDX12_005479 [Alectoria sarmentosa]|nr:MAG: hypothetical protein ASARMPREDX12_005479 [Alectoria sarmentosa]